jgi:hypothetical protein
MKKLNAQTLLILSLALSAATPALARDSSHTSCSGYLPLVNAADPKIGLAFQIDNSRSSTGNGRDEIVSVVYQGVLFQGKAKADNQIVLKQVGHPERVLFKGTYSTDGGALEISGQLSQDPSDPAFGFSPTQAELPCIDLSI